MAFQKSFVISYVIKCLQACCLNTSNKVIYFFTPELQVNYVIILIAVSNMLLLRIQKWQYRI